MPILSQDIRLLASERLTDNEDGGGRITGNEVVDGQSNNLFPDISDLDRTYGRVSLRKTFVGVRTDDTDVYYGGHIILDEAPEDPNVGVSLFTTNDYADERTAARDRIESYVVVGALSRLRLLDDQLEGQRQLIAYQSVDAKAPEIGEVLVLTTDQGEFKGEMQFVRITETSSETQTFEDGQGLFDRAVVTLGIGAPLRYRFYGQAVLRSTSTQPYTRVRTTTVADVARYFTTSPLIQDAVFGDTTLRAKSIFTPVVPSARAETPVLDVRAAGDLTQVVPAGEIWTRTLNANFSQPFYTARPIVPGTLVVDSAADDGAGNLKQNGNVIADVDYEQGIVTPIGDQGTAGTVTFQPGAAVTGVTWTADQEITLGTRGYNYTFNLRPIPWLGTLLVDYRAQGQWYRLRENGNGELVPDDVGAGSGTVNFQTGSILVTLGALPDVGTSVIAYWGSREQYSYVPASTPKSVEIRQTLNEPSVLQTLSLTWTYDGTNYSADATLPSGGYPQIIGLALSGGSE